MLPQSHSQSHLKSKRIAPQLCLGLVFLFLCGFILLSGSLRVAASTPPHLSTAVQAASPLIATPVVSVTVPVTGTSIVRAPNGISKTFPLLYDRAFINNKEIFIPTVLQGVVYQTGATKAFDAAAFKQAQAQMPGNICSPSMSAADCATKREQYLLDNGKLGVFRNQGQLSIALTNYATIVLTDIVGTNGIASVSYRYAEYMPALNQHHVTIADPEGSHELLINAETGETTVLPDSSLVISPDHKRFVAASQLNDAYLNLQVWNAQRPRLNLEADMQIEMPDNVEDLHLTKATWVDSTNVRVDTVEPTSQITGTIMLALTPTGWQASYNGQKIYAPVLYPQSVLNPVSVFGVDTMAVGKRVYTDRAYKFKTVPAVVNGQQYLLFANNNMRNTDADYVHFTPARPATVYVALDIEASELPGWLKDGWTPTPDILTTDDVVKLRLYKKSFDAGEEIILGGNWAPPASEIRSHYIVIVAPN